MVIDVERPKLKEKVNGIEREGLLDSGADGCILSQESWDPNWPVQEVSTQLWVLEPYLR